jgi:hypothetical protein
MDNVQKNAITDYNAPCQNTLDFIIWAYDVLILIPHLISLNNVHLSNCIIGDM